MEMKSKPLQPEIRHLKTKLIEVDTCKVVVMGCYWISYDIGQLVSQVGKLNNYSKNSLLRTIFFLARLTLVHILGVLL